MKPIRGTHDRVGDVYNKFEWIKSQFQKQAQLYHFENIDLPILEHAELYTHTAGQTSDIVSKELFIANSLTALQHNSANLDYSTVLRPEGTASCIRALVNSGKIDEAALRVVYSGPMFRYNRPQKGRFRELSQLGCEVLNQNNAYTDIENIKFLMDFAWSIGLNCKLHLNTLGDGVTERASLGIYKAVLQDFFQTNINLLSESTQAKLAVNVLRALDQLNAEEKAALSQNFPNILDYLTKSELESFEETCKGLDALGVPYLIDPYLIRGLDYYCNVVFELMNNNQAVAGGGSYLFERAKFGLNPKQNRYIYGSGWAAGLDRLEDLVEYSANKKEVYFILAEDSIYGLQVAAELRREGKICVSIFDSVKNGFKRAASADAYGIVICGFEEAKQRVIKVKTHLGEHIYPLKSQPIK